MTNLCLDGRTGTETFLRDLALSLKASGQAPMVYSPRLGEIAREIQSHSIPVVARLADLPSTPDLIHGHHHVQTMEAFLHFPNVSGLYVCHDRLYPYDLPPLFHRIPIHVAVDHNCRERILHSGIAAHQIRIIHNSVDTHRFLSRPPLPKIPKKALLFFSHTGETRWLRPFKSACDKLGISLDVAGGSPQKITRNPEVLLGKYDLVFAKARCALEAMVTGASVILCDYKRLGPMVTMKDLVRLRALNFGMRCLFQPVTETSLIQQIRNYQPLEAGKVSKYLRSHASLNQMTQEYLEVYQEILNRRLPSHKDLRVEFRDYLSNLELQRRWYESLLSGNRSRQFRWVLQTKVRKAYHSLRQPSKLWNSLPGRWHRAFGQLPKLRQASGSDQNIPSVQFETLRPDLKKIFTRISMAENLILKHSLQIPSLLP